MTDYKQLCVELLLINKVKNALAEPEPEEPTDEELLCIAAESIEPYSEILPGKYEPENYSALEVYGSELIIYARAVLARWGNYPASPDSSTSPRSENG